MHAGRRVVANLDADGRVSLLPEAGSKAVFGFEPDILLGHPLTDFVSTFKRYADKHGEAGLEKLMASAIER